MCQSSALADDQLDEVEQMVKSTFASDLSEVDTSSGAVEFHLASVVGRAHGAEQCRKVYARCRMDFDELAATLRQTMAQASNNLS